jgi:hypothetical protein
MEAALARGQVALEAFRASVYEREGAEQEH